MLEVRNIFKEYRPKKGQPVKALDGVSIKFPEKGLVFILGKSGSGKSTLLNVLGGLDQVDSGEIVIKGKSSKDFSQSEFDSYRNTYLGFIFQEYNILNEFNVGDNISLALQLQGKKADQEAVGEILHQVDLEGYAKRKPMELSGGQKQRVAIARALIKNPDIILADEPTGALDSATGIQVFDTLKKLSKEKLVIVVSHDRDFAERYGDRVIELKDGRVLSDEEKVLSSGKTISEGMVSLSDKVFTFQKGHKLTEEDVIYLNKILEEQDAILSADPKSNKAVKEATHLSEGNEQEFFQPTDEKKITYQDESFRLIKSRLPLGRAIKMGGSALKSKPIRLFFTVLLSSIAFALFGCVATMAAFNKAETILTGLKSRPYSTGVATYLTQRVYSNNYSSYIESGFDADDIEDFKNRYNLNGDPVISASSWSGVGNGNNYLDPSEIGNSTYTLYSQYAFGFLRKTPSEIQALGYTLLSGDYPSKADEILITDYTLLSYKQAGYADYGKNPKVQLEASAVNETSILGKTIYASQEDGTMIPLTVVGVLNTHLDYENLYPNFAVKEISWEAVNKEKGTLSEINYRVKKNYPNCFYVHESFKSKREKAGGFLSDFEGIWLDSDLRFEDVYGNVSYFYARNFGSLSCLKAGNSLFLGSPKSSLSNQEVLISADYLLGLVDVNGINVPEQKKNQTIPILDRAVDSDGNVTWSILQENRNLEDFYSYASWKTDRLIYDDCLASPVDDSNEDWVRYCQEYYYSSYQYDSSTGISTYNPGDYASLSEQQKAYAYWTAIRNPDQITFDPERFSPATISLFQSSYGSYNMATNPFGGYRSTYYEQLASMKSVSDLNAVPSSPISLRGSVTIQKEGVFEPEEYEDLMVVGFYVDPDPASGIVVSDSIYSTLSSFRAKPYRNLLFSYEDVSSLRALVTDSATYADKNQLLGVFRFDNEAMDAGSLIFSIVEIFTKILIYVAIALAAFSALLMANFISTSISYKKREIGILRAVGARSSDVFSIFFSEAAIIALIEFLISFFGTMGLMIYFNIYISQETGIIGQTFVYGPLQWALMLGISLIVAFLASFLPVILVAKKKPVDAIRAVV